MTHELVPGPPEPPLAQPQPASDTAAAPQLTLRVAGEIARVDLEAAQRAAADFLSALGIELDRVLPFSGVAHVGYLPGERILGLSKLVRLVEHFAARPRTQERLTKQVADARSRAEFFTLAGVPGC
jgi:GTP cyclohydrolase I